MKNFPVIAAIVFSFFVNTLAQHSDAALRRVREQDAASRDENGKLQLLTAAEHSSRAEVYSSNRLFPDARAHWMILIENYPDDAAIPAALFGIARSYMWERNYRNAVEWFEKLTRDHLATRDGREGLAFKGASYVRMGKNIEAAKTYEQYAVMFPAGERIESAYLNIIDAYREAGEFDKANLWVAKTVEMFAGKPTEANALQARIRIEIFRQNWADAVNSADTLLLVRSFAGSMTTSDEAKYLKAFALEKLGKHAKSIDLYSTISPGSYYGGLASERLVADQQVKKIGIAAPRLYADYPIRFSQDVIYHSKLNGIDPRFVLAIMKQESTFRSDAKSPAAARGLLQLVFDTALKFKDKAGFPDLQPDDLYKPSVNIAIGALYIGNLKDEFGGLYEGIAASYNAGEDNAARWLNRSRPKEAGIFSAEVGFAETKNYVFKVMNNYRIYRELYTENLEKR